VQIFQFGAKNERDYHCFWHLVAWDTPACSVPSIEEIAPVGGSLCCSESSKAPVVDECRMTDSGCKLPPVATSRTRDTID